MKNPVKAKHCFEKAPRENISVKFQTGGAGAAAAFAAHRTGTTGCRAVRAYSLEQFTDDSLLEVPLIFYLSRHLS